ncbi:DNRLRE domain-containing protein [Streptomyces peucetius]|uniref:DNRLRE domain-containing protein n=1 Tax=Streptomyces peucetius TaxID=1950 RepID=A0ABY6IF65_STRPE|nr:DNRLRE domain-containing protein [Streptomyces peucetius]UYQ64487.1 DNRLRE domain-containing protein [Streptomyces peucetius]
MEGAAVGAESQSVQAERPTNLGPAQADDETSAQVMARLQKRRIEILDARTDSTTSWANPDGTVTVESFTGPIRVKDSHGAWQPVDVTLSEVDGKVLPKTAAADIAFSAGGSAAPLAQVTRGEKTFGVAWEGALPKPVLNGNTATYPNAVPGGDVVVSALPEGFSHSVVLRERPSGPVEFRLPVKAKGLTLDETADERLRWQDSKGKQVAAAPPPLMWDGTEDAKSREPENTAIVTTTVETTADGRQTLVLKPSEAFLSDPDVTYPVVVDPTNTLAGPTTDTWIQYDAYPSSQRGSTELKAGTYDGVQKARSFLKFDVAKYAGKKIVDTDLRLYSYYSSTCSTSGSGVQVRRVTSDWDPSAVSWSAQPSTTTTGAVTSTAAKGYNSSCPAGLVSWDVDAVVQAWADGQPNYGVRLAAVSETDTLTWRRYRSANYVDGAHDPNVEPSLTVTYNSYPAVPTAQAITPSAVNAYNAKRYVTSLTPTMSAKVSDVDGGTVKAQFEVTPDPAYNDTTYTYTALSGSVASGSTASLTIPSTSAFPAGTHLRYRVRGYDGSLYGSWTGYTAFVLNTAKPAAPSIVCDPYTKDTWTAKAANGAQCTLDTTSTDGQGYYWGLNDPNTPNRVDDTVDGNGGDPKTVTINPADGWHTLYAKTVDSGGNLSTSATEYKFGIGADGAAILTPGDGDRPARRVALSATGKPTYTGVTYQYRRGETDAWANVPLADVTKNSDGSAVTAWPLAAPNGAPPALVWNITSTFADDGPIDVRAAFTDGTTTGYSQPVTVTVDRDAGTAPFEEVGPGSVNLLTGDYTLSESDASAFDMSVTRTASSRRPDAGAKQEGQAPIFGPQWTSGTVAELTESDWVYVKKTSATSVALVDVDGEETGFTATTGGGWTPEPGGEDLTLTGSLTGSFTLKDTEGTTTTFTKADPAVTTWAISSTYLPTSNSTTKVVSQTTTVDGKTVARPKWVIAPTSAVSASTCEADPSTKGCRVLEYLYPVSTTATATSFGDYVGRVKRIRLWSTAPAATTSTAVSIAAYAYDDSGRLREVSDPRISPALKTAYDYDAAGRVTTLTPPGELPWTFTYGTAGNAATAGAGMLLKASRPGLHQGSSDITEGTAATSVVYDVPLSGTTAPYAMGAADVKAWGQFDVPTDATAVFPVDVTPAGHAGSSLTATDYKRATITYTDASGREVNSITPGGHITTTEYDRFGNTVRELSAGNRAIALGLTASDTAVQTSLGITQYSNAERAELLSTRSVYNATGTRELEEFGPLRRVELTKDLVSGSTTLLQAGASVAARTWTVNEYDTGRPTDGTATVENQVTKSTTGAQILDFPTIHAETRATQTDYDWVKGLPVKVIQDPAGLALTTTTEYDAQGRITKQRLPGATGTDAATRVTTYWSATGTGTCAGRPEWADLVCSTGPAGAITGGGTNPSQLPTSTTEYDQWGNPTKLTDTANGVTRTTTTTYDVAGRPTKVTVTGGLGQAVPESTTEYATDTGKVIKTISPTGGTITKAYDKLGRQISYTDADGGTTTTEYDLLDRPVKVTDTVPSTVTYTYDHTAEPRGLATKATDSIAGAFEATYDADGSVATEKLPGGYTLTTTEDTTGATTSRLYTRDTDGEIVVSDTVTESVHGQVTAHTGWSDQSYRYDNTGRLTTVLDTVSDVCTRRSYAFDQRTNRTALTTATAAANAACPTTGGTTTSHAYDSADRLVDTGYTYDAFGRTTALPGSTLGYYANDLAYQQTANGKRQIWQLDANLRFRSWTVETDTSGTWTQTASKRNHYDSDSDNPRWIIEDTTSGDLTRNVESIGGDLAATTSKTGDTVLQLTNIHGDVALQLPLDTTKAPTALDSDEYGIPRTSQAAARYNWLGAKQRSTETLTGLTLMGVRLYNPTTGRFLSMDPLYGGSANAYEYANADPLNRYDLDGRWAIFKTLWKQRKHVKRFVKWSTRYKPTKWLFFAKKNKNFVMRDGRPGIHWGNHKNRLEWDRVNKWHYNKAGSKGHYSPWRGVWNLAKHIRGKTKINARKSRFGWRR